MKGNKTKEFLDMSSQYERKSCNWQAPVVWDHGQGAEIWDVDGKHYIDWTSGVLVANVGHAHPKLADALHRQAKRLLNPFDFATPERLTLAKRLVRVVPRRRWTRPFSFPRVRRPSTPPPHGQSATAGNSRSSPSGAGFTAGPTDR